MTPSFSAVNLAQWSGGSWTTDPGQPLCGVSHDTRTLPAGSLYVALRGTRCDGHDYLERAFAVGAAAAMTNRERVTGRNGKTWSARPLLQVDDTRRALGALAHGYRRSHGAWIAGITGSMGKTTVKDMLADMLRRRQPTARTAGNWNNDIGLPLSLLAMPHNAQAGVFELGVNHPGEMKPLCEILAPNAGTVTTVATVHIEHFRNMRELADEKADLLRRLPRDGLAALNRDEAWFAFLRDQTACRVTTVSTQSDDADYYGSIMRAEAGEIEVVERASAERRRFRLGIPGAHAVANALLALALARSRGVTWPDIAAALAAYRPAPMRWQTLEIGGTLVINDAYNANPESMRAAIRTFAALYPARGKWLALGDMLELGSYAPDAHREIGAWLAQWPWRGLIAVGKLGAVLAEGALRAGLAADRLHRCDDAAAAGEVLAERMAPGEAVLLKASRGVKMEEATRVWLQRENLSAEVAV
jgi:UDP-N-acetylmuramoyl-tripeptide--D-alanyl-D-alanine ligase